MRSELEILDMIKHFDGHANDPRESLEQRNKYSAMVTALEMVLE